MTSEIIAALAGFVTAAGMFVVWRIYDQYRKLSAKYTRLNKRLQEVENFATDSRGRMRKGMSYNDQHELGEVHALMLAEYLAAENRYKESRSRLATASARILAVLGKEE